MADEINITYETLFEILRLEKNRIELQKLDKDFYLNVSTYIKDKTQIFKKESQEMQGKQLSNIKKIVRDIYFRRMKKIMNIAFSINSAPGSLAEKESMLDEEVAIFNSFNDLISQNKIELLDAVIEGKGKKEEIQEPENMMVRFLSAVPKFIGEDMEQYGPFQAEDMANLPKRLADILIAKGNASPIND